MREAYVVLAVATYAVAWRIVFSREFAARCENPRSELAGIELAQVELRGAIISVDQAVVFAEALGLDVRTLSSVPASYGGPGGFRPTRVLGRALVTPANSHELSRVLMVNRFMRLRVVLIVSVLLSGRGTVPRALPAQTLSVAYREPADVFEILDNVSNWWPGYTDDAYLVYWRDSVGFTAGDSLAFVQYAVLRHRYFRKDGQGNSAPQRDGSGLFTDRATLEADPVGTAFYRSETMEMAYSHLRDVVNADDLRALRRFYARFAARVAPLTAQTKRHTQASLALTARTLALDGIAPYVAQVARLLGVSNTVSFTALYVWWPDTTRNEATPNGRHLILRVRPAADDTVNSADVVMHEAVHVLSALAPESQKQQLSGAILDRCTVPAGVRPLVVVEEGIATALGNIEFRRRFMPQRVAWSRRWYGDEWVDLSARLLYPMLTLALAEGKPLGAAFGRDAGAMCALQARLRTPPAER